MAIIAAATTPYTQEPSAGVIKTISGAIAPESKYLEPTLGQIWPR